MKPLGYFQTKDLTAQAPRTRLILNYIFRMHTDNKDAGSPDSEQHQPLDNHALTPLNNGDGRIPPVIHYNKAMVPSTEENEGGAARWDRHRR